MIEFAESEDHLTLTYTLNPEAVWHNGNPITAADWQAHVERPQRAQPGVPGRVDGGLRPDHVRRAGCRRVRGRRHVLRAVPGLRGAVLADLARPSPSPIPRRSTPGGSARSTTTGSPVRSRSAPTTTPRRSSSWCRATRGGAPSRCSTRSSSPSISPDATPQAFANNEIDSFDIGPDPNGYALAFNTPGSEIRAAAGPNWRHVTLNSGPNGGLIQDQVVRQAIQMSLDRAAIGVSDLAGIPWPAKPLNNHVFVENSPFYVDNAGEFGTYNPDGGDGAARGERLGRRGRRRAGEGRPAPDRPLLAARRRAGVGERGSAPAEPARRGRHRGRDRRRPGAGVRQHADRRRVRDDGLLVDRHAVPVPRRRSSCTATARTATSASPTSPSSIR